MKRVLLPTHQGRVEVVDLLDGVGLFETLARARYEELMVKAATREELTEPAKEQSEAEEEVKTRAGKKGSIRWTSSRSVRSRSRA